jgi:hypothetical protein
MMQLAVSDRWYLVQARLASTQQDTQAAAAANQPSQPETPLDRPIPRLPPPLDSKPFRHP